MRYGSSLCRGVLIERVASVLADVRLDEGGIVTAYCPNMTRMTGLAPAGCDVFLSCDDYSYGRIRYTVEAVGVNGTLVGIDLDIQAALVAEAVENGVFDGFNGYDSITAAAFPSVCDLDLTGAGRTPCRVAVLPVYEKRAASLIFPDGVETASRLVLRDLEQRLDAGDRAVLVLLAQRIDCLSVRADPAADPVLVGSLKNLCDKGLEIIAAGCTVSPEDIAITALLPFVF